MGQDASKSLDETDDTEYTSGCSCLGLGSLEEVSVDDEEEVCETRTAAHFYGDYGPDDDAAAHFYGDNAAVLTDPASLDVGTVRPERKTLRRLDSLFEACEAGDQDECREILEAGTVDVNSIASDDGYTALIIACEEGERRGAERFFRACARLFRHQITSTRERERERERARARMRERSSLLVPSSCDDGRGRSGNAEICEMLIIDAGADVSIQDASGRTALMVAAVEGHAHLIPIILSGANCDVEAANPDGQTPFWAACALRRVEAAQTLLTTASLIGTPINVDARDIHGITPMSFASSRGHAEIIQLLNDNDSGKQPRSRLSGGSTPPKARAQP